MDLMVAIHRRRVSKIFPKIQTNKRKNPNMLILKSSGRRLQADWNNFQIFDFWGFWGFEGFLIK